METTRKSRQEYKEKLEGMLTTFGYKGYMISLSSLNLTFNIPINSFLGRTDRINPKSNIVSIVFWYDGRVTNKLTMTDVDVDKVIVIKEKIEAISALWEFARF